MILKLSLTHTHTHTQIYIYIYIYIYIVKYLVFWLVNVCDLNHFEFLYFRVFPDLEDIYLFMVQTRETKNVYFKKLSMSGVRFRPIFTRRTTAARLGFVVRGESPGCRLFGTASMLEWLRICSPTTQRGTVRKVSPQLYIIACVCVFTT